ncbi:hypothetical protein KQX54_018768 [Cotesia glomerata]|uniref:Uncharacterized protein n=1 Tax=Cotesia glomerata TaxID=32391 RepID=A0AAV7J9B4_COTGL|nr:hypothetical protein KQX54_018768 [Cotesia glomerata]
MYMCICCTEDKKGGVDRSSTVIAKEPEGYASQGTPPNSPAAASIFSKVMGAAAASKQNQGSGNSLGIAAVLLHGAQADSGHGNSNSSSSGGSTSTSSQNSQTGILSSFPSVVSVNSPPRHRNSSAAEDYSTDNNRRASNFSEVEDGKKNGLSDGVLSNTKLSQQNICRRKCSLV